MGKFLVIKGAYFSAVAVGSVTPTPTPGKTANTVVASPSSGGTVSSGGSYEKGATITITATPKSGYRFVQWNNVQ